jgi:hypothetical protein
MVNITNTFTLKTCVQNTTLFSSFLPLEIVSREIKTNEHKLENYRRSHIIDLLKGKKDENSVVF